MQNVKNLVISVITENPASYKIKRGVSHMHENMGPVFFALQNHRVELKF